MPGIWPFSHEMKSPLRQGSQVKSQPPNQPTPTRSPLAAGVHLHADLSWVGFGNFDFGQFELFIRRGDAGDLHRGHVGEITTACG